MPRSPISRLGFISCMGIALAALPLMTACSGSAPRPAGGIQPPAVGAKAPDFTLNTLDGKAVTLSEINKSGPVVVVALRGWNGYQCPLCNQQVGDLASHGADLTAAGAQVVLIYPGVADGLADHAKEFNSGAGLPAGFHFVTDPNMAMITAWGLRWDEEGETAYPSAFVLDANGTVKFAKVSNSHGGRASSEEILATLKE